MPVGNKKTNLYIEPNFVKRDYKDGVTGLMIACLQNDYDQVVYQVKTLKSEINYQKDDGTTALMTAIYKKNLNIVKFLCENGADKNIKDYLNNTALIYAIYLHPESAIYLIMNGADINIKNNLNESTMHFASMAGELFIMKLLYERGAEINTFNVNNHTPLMMACGNKHMNAVKYLVKNGADINTIDINYDNLLHGCIHHQTYDILLYFLSNKKINIINDRNNDNETALLYAVKQLKEDTIKYVELLLKYGADPNITCDKDGNTPLIYTIKNNNYELSEVLLKYGANPNQYFTFMGYSSPLYYAVKNKNSNLMQLLFNYHANDLMYIYIEMNNYDMFKNLLGKKTLNIKNSNGDTLLLFAVNRNKINFVELLLENGADPNICNHKNRNESPLYQAIMNRNYNIFKLLIKYKADYNHRLTVNEFSGSKLGESILGKADRYCWSSKICDDLKEFGAVLFYEWD